MALAGGTSSTAILLDPAATLTTCVQVVPASGARAALNPPYHGKHMTTGVQVVLAGGARAGQRGPNPIPITAST